MLLIIFGGKKKESYVHEKWFLALNGYLLCADIIYCAPIHYVVSKTVSIMGEKVQLLYNTIQVDG